MSRGMQEFSLSDLPPTPPQSGFVKYRKWIIVALVVVIVARVILILVQGRI